jgi:hypothetical protein
MSGVPWVELEDLDGTHGWVRTSGFVRWVEDINSHQPRQRVRIGDDTTGGDPVVCTVFDQNKTLEQGCGYRLSGVDRVYDRYDEVQLMLVEESNIEKTYDKDED